MANKLMEQINERIKEAAEKRIGDKASTIARVLGTGNSTIGENKEVRISSYRSGELEVKDYFSLVSDAEGKTCDLSTTVTYGNQVVFERGRFGTLSYVPGNWETPFNNLYSEANSVIQKQRDAEKAEKEAELKTRWGLNTIQQQPSRFKLPGLLSRFKFS